MKNKNDDTFQVSKVLGHCYGGPLIIPEKISTLEEAQREELKVKEQNDAGALYLIQQSLANTIFPRIIGASTTKHAGDVL